MIVFASHIGDHVAYSRFVAPSIRAVAESDSVVLTFATVDGASRNNNLLLEAAREIGGLEALVLLNEYTEIIDAEFAAKVRSALEDPLVGVVGCLGGRGFRGCTWSNGEVSGVDIEHRYRELGGGSMTLFESRDVTSGLGEVDAVDGMLMVLSPWAVKNVDFDEAFTAAHGYDVDYCRQIKAAGRTVVTADLGVRRHHPLELRPHHALRVAVHMQVAQKWDLADQDEDPNSERWKQRARRAEAELSASRAHAQSKLLDSDVNIAERTKALEVYTKTYSWQLTEPLRWANAKRAARKAARS